MFLILEYNMSAKISIIFTAINMTSQIDLRLVLNQQSQSAKPKINHSRVRALQPNNFEYDRHKRKLSKQKQNTQGFEKQPYEIDYSQISMNSIDRSQYSSRMQAVFKVNESQGSLNQNSQLFQDQYSPQSEISQTSFSLSKMGCKSFLSNSNSLEFQNQPQKEDNRKNKGQINHYNNEKFSSQREGPIGILESISPNSYLKLNYLENGIAMITFEWRDGVHGNVKSISQSTGFFINSQEIITARHSIYRSSDGKKCNYCTVKIIRSYESKQLTFKSLPSSEWSEEQEYDLALIRLKKPHHFEKAFNFATEDILRGLNPNTKMFVAGYSLVYRREQNACKDKLNILNVNYQQVKEVHIQYEGQTVAGLSGSPVFAQINQNCFVIVGMHLSRKQTPSNDCRGLIFKEDMREKIKRWQNLSAIKIWILAHELYKFKYMMLKQYEELRKIVKLRIYELSPEDIYKKHEQQIKKKSEACIKDERFTIRQLLAFFSPEEVRQIYQNVYGAKASIEFIEEQRKSVVGAGPSLSIDENDNQQSYLDHKRFVEKNIHNPQVNQNFINFLCQDIPKIQKKEKQAETVEKQEVQQILECFNASDQFRQQKKKKNKKQSGKKARRQSFIIIKSRVNINKRLLAKGKKIVKVRLRQLSTFSAVKKIRLSLTKFIKVKNKENKGIIISFVPLANQNINKMIKKPTILIVREKQYVHVRKKQQKENVRNVVLRNLLQYHINL